MQGSQRHTKSGNHEGGEGRVRSLVVVPPLELPPTRVAVTEGDKLRYAEGGGTKAMGVPHEFNPRSIRLTRSLDYGFTLRHFIVYPPDESEIGFKGEEALFLNRQDPLDTIFVKHVKERSPAHFAGLKTGDRILSVNEADVRHHSYKEIVSIIQTSHSDLRLVVVPKEYDVLQQVFSQAAHNPESNLNVKFSFSPEPSVGPPSFSCSSWSSRSSLSSLHLMPSPISYQAHPPNPGSFPIAPPRNTPKPVAPPLIPVTRHSPARHSPSRHSPIPSQMPVFPAHRKGPLPLSKVRVASPSRHGSPQNGPRLTPSSSHSQSKRKPLTATTKDPHKKRSPLVLDRKQAVYNINNNSLSASRQRSASDHNVKGNAAGKRSSSTTKDDSQTPLCNNKNIRTSSPDPGDINRIGIFEPVIVKGEIKGRSEPKRLEKDPDGRLYEVVQTKLVKSKMAYGNEKADFSNKRLSLPVVKSSTESNLPRRKDSSQHLSSLFSNPSKAAKLEMGMAISDSSDLSKDLRNSYSNKENIAKNLNTSSPYATDRPTQKVIERIKKNIEKKEEFLKRPNEPFWKQPTDDSLVPREYHVNPQKMQRPMWPPPPTQPPPTLGALTKALSFVLGNKGENQVLRRVKSEAEGPRTVSFPSTVTPSLEQYKEEVPLTYEARSNSLPSSPTTTTNETGTHQTFPSPAVSSPYFSSLPSSLNPLTGNIVAKPYGTHLNEDGTPVAKFGRPFISTLSRIHENIPSTCKDLPTSKAIMVSSSVTTTPTSTPMGSQTSLSSLPTTSSATKTVPLVWVGDNERIKQLQIVSTRAKKFESPNAEKESRKTAFHRFELSRLSQRANAFNVATRKKEFEKRGSEAFNKNSQGLSFELGTTFDCSSRLKKMEDANWRGSKGVVKSLSDGGNFFAVSREYCSLPEVSCSTTASSTEMLLAKGTGNRTIPVGGPKIHCEPPDSKHLTENRPENDTDSFERNRANSTSSHDAFWPSAGGDAPQRKRPPLVRQHSFHSTFQSHLALADVPEPEVAEASLCSGGLILASESPREEGAGWPHLSGPSAPLHGRPERPTFLPIESHARPSEEGHSPPSPLTHHRCMPPPVPHDQGAVSSIQQRIVPSFDGSSISSGSAAVSTNGTRVAAAGVSKRNKYGDDNDRLFRRVSYLKATSGDRICSDSESDDEKPLAATSPASLARRAIGGQTPSEDLPSPASFLSSVTSSGSLIVKLAKLHGKRAGDRSWKSVWAVIRGRALLLYKDMQHAIQTPLSPEDQVSLRGADAGVASDYTKRRHVFRLSTPAGSQFLLQAESEPAMTAWLNSITVAASQDVEPHLKAMTPTPDNDSLSPYIDIAPVSMATTPTSSAASGSLYTAEAHTISEGNVSPQLIPKNVKKITSPLRTKSPSGLTTTAKGRKTGEIGSSPKSKTWKGRLGRHLRKMQGTASLTPPSAPLPEGASIGVCLEDCPPSAENEFVPLLVSLCVGVVESKGLHIQGIYRIPGNRAAVTHLIETVNRGPKAVDLTDTRWSDVNVISSLLKQFFQRLPDPLIPSDLYPHFIEASKHEDPQQKLIELRNLVQELPEHQFETLRFLCFHLSHVTSNASINKMDVRNLAIVFGPTLVRAADDNMAKMVTDMSHQCRIVEMLISQVNWFFNDEESEDPPPIIASSGTQNPLSVENAAFASEMEASSQSLLLGNVQKLEASHKDSKKLLVSSIISAANRTVQKVRKKMEEENVSSDQEAPPLQSNYDAILRHSHELPDPLPMSQRRVSGMSTSEASTAIVGLCGSNRDARLFGDNCNPLFAKDDRLDSLSSLNTLTTPPTFSTSPNSGIATTTSSSLNAASLSKSEPSYLGEDMAFRSYAGLSASTQERIRRFEMETRAMLQRDVTRHRRELLDKKKIEEELQKAKKDLETEDIYDRLADNPSQVVHMMNDYCWSPNREAVSLPSLRSSVPSDPLKSRLAKSSLVPSTGITNASAKDDKLSNSETGMTHQRPNHEGSDLLNAINATFEKMKSLQDTPLLHAETDQRDGRSPSRTSTSSDSAQLHQEEPSTSSSNSQSSSSSSNSSSSSSSTGGSAGTKCKLYRDPSLHRRRTFRHSFSSDAISTTDLGNKEPDSDSTIQECVSMGDKIENSTKEKSEKRTRELMRTETQESLREKKPKELKRSNTKETFCDPCLIPAASAPSSRKEKRDSSSKQSSDLRSRKHNVRELKEKFERNSPPTLPAAVSTPPSSKSPTAPGNEKSSRASLKQARKARIKRRHTVGGMKDLARVAWLKVIEAAHYADPQKVNQVTPQSTQLPSWEQLQLFLEALAEGRKMNVDTQSLNTWVAREKLGSSTPDLDSILSLVLPPQQKEALKRRLSVREPSMKPLHPVLESNV